MHHTSLIALLVVGFALAFLFGGLAHRLRLSPLVGYLLAGVLMGPFTPGFIGDASLAPQLAEIGVILLMFGVGLHFSLRDLLDVKNIAVPGALVQIAVVTALGWGLARLIGWPNVTGIVFGLALSVASTVVVLRGLEERRLLDTSRGRIAVGWLIVEDLAMVLALVLLPALGGREGGSLGGALLTTIAKVGGFVVFMLLVGKRVIPWILERVAATGSRELFTLCVLTIALGVAFGSAHLFGVSFALGAFFAGVILSESEFSHQAANETLPLRDAFAVLFFVSVGMLFDPMILVTEPVNVLATFLVVVVGNGIAAWAVARLLGKPSGTARLLAVSLSQIGEFSFILAGLGVSLGMLSKDGQSLILAAAILSIIVNPLLFALHDRIEARRERGKPEAIEVISPPLPDGERPHVILIGYGRVGSELGPLLQAHDIPLVVIDDDLPLVERARAAGIPAVRGHAANPAVLSEARPDRAQMALVAIPNAFESGEIIERLRELNPTISVIARAHSDAGVKYLLERGADGAVMAERELAHSLAEMVGALPAFRGERSLPPATA
ncbi:Kef family K(+) transporter [Lysobacter sp. TY2-98]|uniref:YbaL family putative K(+) efflux transporter n=1 Tax=Lysobacter sp. TY2-98 TaxID=2290922 RepID=UPI000E200176|nr:YbaL family putative K(+) efflux transporter [Lysobacter sp. TY2-98]AXK71008.1 Kef family K(+) transporter [Lysobacter sp. TY2-98]